MASDDILRIHTRIDELQKEFYENAKSVAVSVGKIESSVQSIHDRLPEQPCTFLENHEEKHKADEKRNQRISDKAFALVLRFLPTVGAAAAAYIAWKNSKPEI